MIQPSLSEFQSLSKQNPVTSVYETMPLDTETPITVLYKFLDERDFVLLEGISKDDKHDRFSYFGFDPYLKVKCQPKNFEFIYDSGKTETKTGDFYGLLRSLIKQYTPIQTTNQPDYGAGLMGSMSYECHTFLENIPTPGKRQLDSPYATFIVPKSMLIFDNFYNTITLVRNCFGSNNSEETYNEATSYLLKLKEKVTQHQDTHMEPLGDPLDPHFEFDILTNVSKEAFMKRVKICKDYIKAGDIFQIQVSRRAQKKIKKDPIMLYRYLRNFNPSPFMFYAKFNDAHLIGSSPEILVGVHEGKMTIRPLAGTRKRQSKSKSEIEICNELLNDEKEKAEHIMLVDLARHEVGRACKIGSVKVNELLNIEKYTHVIHMVSDVSGILKDDMDAIDAFKFGYPAGTVTGTPKIRAMEIISELEDIDREFYAGGIVFFDFKGNLKSTITIRSIYIKDGIASTQAAAGIVADSIPEQEYLETQNKMRSCLSAIQECS